MKITNSRVGDSRLFPIIDYGEDAPRYLRRPQSPDAVQCKVCGYWFLQGLAQHFCPSVNAVVIPR
jgi:hypothetical protein